MNNISEERKYEIENELLDISSRLLAITKELGITIHLDGCFHTYEGGKQDNYLNIFLHDYKDGKYGILLRRIVVPEEITGILSEEFEYEDENEE